MRLMFTPATSWLMRAHLLRVTLWRSAVFVLALNKYHKTDSLSLVMTASANIQNKIRLGFRVDWGDHMDLNLLFFLNMLILLLQARLVLHTCQFKKVKSKINLFHDICLIKKVMANLCKIWIFFISKLNPSLYLHLLLLQIETIKKGWNCCSRSILIFQSCFHSGFWQHVHQDLLNSDPLLLSTPIKHMFL